MGEENCSASIDLLTARSGFALATPSVMQQLADMARHGRDEALRGVASKTLQSMATWNFLMPSLAWKEHALAEAAAKKMMGKGLCTNYQRALVLAEASVTNSRLLLTFCPHLLAQPGSALTLLPVENHIPDCTPMPPHYFAHWFKNSVKQPGQP